jgi:electron transfer flavoprotein beta subunit
VKVVVCVKQVVTVPSLVVLLDGGSDVNPLFTRSELNESDEYAVEEALQINESHGGELVVASVGPDRVSEVLRKCISLGVHRASRVWKDGLQTHDPLAVARALALVAHQESADLILCGVQSADASQQATGPALASALGYPCVTMATKIELCPDGERATVHREANGGFTEVVEVDLPAVITVQTGINSPRTASFKDVMMAKKAPVELIDPGNTVQSRIRMLGVSVNALDRGKLELIEGGPAAAAARIRDLVEEAS